MRNRSVAGLLLAVFVFAGVLVPTMRGETPGDGARGAQRELTSTDVPGNRWAILIGIDHYESLKPLSYCVNDAELLRDTLVSSGGYDRQHIHLLADASDKSEKMPTRAGIEMALRMFIGQVGPHDTIFVSFAGHGAVDSAGKSYLLPMETPSIADADLRDFAIPVARVDELLEKCLAKQKILVIDACHSGGTRDAGKGETFGNFSVAKLPEGKGIIELLSCDGAEVSWESPALKHGYFTYYLCKAIASDAKADAHGFVTVDDIYKSTFDAVRKDVQTQHNTTQTPKKRGEVEGSIVMAARQQRTMKSLPAAELVTRLKTLVEGGGVTKQTMTAIEAALVAPEDFPPAERLRQLATFLVEGLVSERDFLSLSRRDLDRVESHENSISAGEGKTFRAIFTGIDKYDDNLLCPGSLQEIKQVEEILKKQQAAGRQVEIQDFANDKARGEAVLAAIGKAADASKSGDVLLLWFSCIGIGKVNLKEGSVRVGATPAEIDPATGPAEFPHRGMTRVSGHEDEDQGGWLMAGSTVKQQVWLGSKEVCERLAKCKADVVIVSCACHTKPPWPENQEFASEWSETMHPQRSVTDQPARIFLGYPGLAFVSNHTGGMTSLGVLVSQALMGEADVMTPERFEGTFTRTFSHRGSPDGFVTLRELVHHIKRFEIPDRNVAAGISVENFIVRGTLGHGDVVLTRSVLPVD